MTETETTTTTKQVTLVRPSQLPRVSACPVSAIREAQVPDDARDTEGEAAMAGTRIHAALASGQLSEIMALDEPEAQTAMKALDLKNEIVGGWLRGLVSDWSQPRQFIETRIGSTFEVDGQDYRLGGTPDFWAYSQSGTEHSVILLDYKTGWVPVLTPPHEHAQMLAYAAMIYRFLKAQHGAEISGNIEIVIVQPNGQPAMTSSRVGLDEIRARVPQIGGWLQAAHKAKMEDDANPNPNACRYCVAKPACLEYINNAHRNLTDAETAAEQYKTTIEALDPDGELYRQAVGEFLDRTRDTIKSLSKMLSEAEEYAKSSGDVPGWTVKKTGGGKTIPPEKIGLVAKALGLSPNDVALIEKRSLSAKDVIDLFAAVRHEAKAEDPKTGKPMTKTALKAEAERLLRKARILKDNAPRRTLVRKER